MDVTVTSLATLVPNSQPELAPYSSDLYKFIYLFFLMYIDIMCMQHAKCWDRNAAIDAPKYKYQLFPESNRVTNFLYGNNSYTMILGYLFWKNDFYQMGLFSLNNYNSETSSLIYLPIYGLETYAFPGSNFFSIYCWFCAFIGCWNKQHTML